MRVYELELSEKALEGLRPVHLAAESEEVVLSMAMADGSRAGDNNCEIGAA